MFIYIIFSKGYSKQIKQKLKNLKLFSKITPLKNNTFKVRTTDNIYDNNTKKIKLVEKKLNEIEFITKIKFYPLLKIPKKHTQSKNLYIFFDIDSTLTRTGLKHLDSNVDLIFKKLQKQNCALFFCSGRSITEINKLRRMYGTGDYGIAENGGYIIGLDESDRLRANKDEPKNFLKYLKEEKIDYTFDYKQHPRKSEFVLFQSSINEDVLKQAITDSKCKVEYHASKDTFHISKSDTNKGTAIDYLASKEELDLTPDMDEKIGIGDSGLDIPMFEYCNRGFMIGIPSQRLKKEMALFKSKITIIKELPPKSLEKIYLKLFPYG